MRRRRSAAEWVAPVGLFWFCVLGVSCASAPSPAPSTSSGVVESVLARLGVARLQAPAAETIGQLFPVAAASQLQPTQGGVEWVGQDSGVEFLFVPDSAEANAKRNVVAALAWHVNASREMAFAVLRGWLERLGESQDLRDDGAPNFERSFASKVSTAVLSLRVYKSAKGWEGALRIDWKTHALVQ